MAYGAGYTNSYYDRSDRGSLRTIWPVSSESFCREQLTSYEVYTIIPWGDDEDIYPEGSIDENKDEDVKIGRVGFEDILKRKRQRWMKVHINQETFPQDQIIETIHKLDAGRWSITEKIARLSPYQRTQVTNILDEKDMNEREGTCFEWAISQLQRMESINPKTGKKNSTSITVYLKRAPLPGVDVINLYDKRYERPASRQVQQQVVSSQDTDQGKQDFVAIDRPTIPTTYEHDVIHQNHASQERIGSLPLASAQDSNQQNQRNTAASSHWSVMEQNNFREYLKFFGSDWHRIAILMETKTHIMVKNYYQRQVDSGNSDLEEMARVADEKRKWWESVALLPHNMSQAQQHQSQQAQQPSSFIDTFKQMPQQRPPRGPTLEYFNNDSNKPIIRTSTSNSSPQPPSDSGYGSLLSAYTSLIPFQQTKAEFTPELEVASSEILCPTCNKVVKTQSELRKHYQRHRTPHVCPYPNCPGRGHGLGFSTVRDLDRHIRSKHQEQGVLFCHFGECQEKGKKFTRSDNFRVHLNRCHGIGKDEIEGIIQREQVRGLLTNNDLNRHIRSKHQEGVVEEPFTDSGYASTRIDLLLPDKPQCPRDDKCTSEMGDEDTEDAKTLYSAATTIDLPQSQQYITELCSDIFRKLENHFDSTNWDALETALTSLIKGFAIKIGHDSSAQVNQDIMYFIHKQHKDIISHLKVMFCPEDDEQLDSRQSGPKGMSLFDKMSMWNNKSGEMDTIAENDELFEGVRDVDDEITNEVDLSMYNGIILKSPSYEWLLSSLKKERSLQWGSRHIRQKILDRFPTGTISKRRPLGVCEVTFNLQLDDTTDGGNGLFTKLITSEILLSKLIAVTGYQKQSQALTVEQYLHQTWPTYSLQLLDILQKAIITYCDHDFVFPDKSQLNARTRGSHFIITAIGPAQFIAECAEQLAWLQAALHSNSGNLAGYCVPSIVNYRVDTTQSRSKQLKYKDHCDITAEIAPLGNPTDAIPQRRSWWQDLIGKSIVIKGFPISRRPEAYTGLELSLELLLSSLQTDEAIIDDGRVLLRGLILTVQLIKDTDDVFLWRPFHLTNEICSCGEYHIAICDTSYSSIDLSRLKAGRHILGVCTDLLPAAVGNSECGINPNEILSISPKSQDEDKDSRSLVRRQVDHSVSNNDSPLYNDKPNGYSPLNDETLLAAESPSNSTMRSQDESLDSDLLSISDSSERFEVPESNEAVDTFIGDVFNTLLSGFRNTPQCQFPPGACGSNGQTIAHTAATGSSTTSDNSGPSRKRRRATEDDDDADQDGFPKPPRKRINLGPDKAPRILFACPYFKMNPVKYRDCCAKKLTRIRDVKQHLQRKHTPDRYCQRCLVTDFSNEEELQEHIDLGTCRRNDPTAFEGVSNDQRKRLSGKSDSKISGEDQWFAIWEILFFGRPRPSSAYMDTGVSVQARQFREYCFTHASSVVEEQYMSHRVWLGAESSGEERQNFIQMLIAVAAEKFEEYCRLNLSESSGGRTAAPPELGGNSMQHTLPEAPPSSFADSGIAADSQSSSRDIRSRRDIPSQPAISNDRGNRIQPVRSDAPLISNADSGASLNIQSLPRDISSLSQLPAISDDREPSDSIPQDEIMQMPEGLRDGLQDVPNIPINADGFDILQRYIPSQAPAIYDGGVPSEFMPQDAMMPEDLAGSILCFPIEYFDPDSFDSLSQPPAIPNEGGLNALIPQGEIIQMIEGIGDTPLDFPNEFFDFVDASGLMDSTWTS